MNILNCANKIVNNRSEEAERNYGPFNESMDRAAEVASVTLGKKVTAHDIFGSLIGLKLSRQGFSHKQDNLLDLVAYIGAWDNYIQVNGSHIKGCVNPFLKAWTDLKNDGVLCCPRGEKTLEILNYKIEFNPYERFANFKLRKFSLKYLKKEFLWYLKGNRFDLSICEHASIWESLVNEDRSLNSNYGYFLFTQQFLRIALDKLILDKDSRRSILMIGNNCNYTSDTKDYLCTESIQFLIRGNKLFMTVTMRSNDAIFGLCNDAPIFSFIHELSYLYLKREYKDLELGTYCHFVKSFHVYERHFKMIDNIIADPQFTDIKAPRMTDDDVGLLFNWNNLDYRTGDSTPFIDWLLSE